MMNKKKPNNRSNKRNVKLSVRYYDHVMSNLSQNRGNSKINENTDEIRVHKKENSDECVDTEVGKMGETSVDCELNEVYESQSMNENECDKNSSDKLDKECLDNSVKECLDNSDKLEKENDIVNISCTNDNKQNDGSSIRDHSNCDRNETSEGSKRTYASAAKNSGWFESNKLFVMPTVLTELGSEVVVFDEELVELGSKKWELTLVGQLIGHTMSLPALNYNLRRMWSRFGFKEIVDNGNGNWLFKFSNELGMTKAEPTKLLVWVKLTNVPMEAWTTKGISAISSSVGRPLIMDSMTAYVCKNGVGRTKYARVLVEIKAFKGFKELVELQYKDKNMNVKVRVRNDEEIAADREEVDKNLRNHKEDNFMQNKVRKPIWNTRMSKQGLVNYSRNICMSGEGPKRRSWEGDREKERNERLDRMEGFVEGVFEEECIAAKNLIADELKGAKKGTCSSTLEEFNEAINEEEKFLFQKAKVDWLCKGQTTPVQHLDSLGNIFTNTLTNEEAFAMVNDVSDQEIRTTMYSIDDCKAPGPDGYSACFFKKAWSV
ncbi:zinc knuckle CX2CX4HX4C containing protein, partial [Tanacetum coccineum]